MAGRRHANWRQEGNGLGPNEPRRDRRPSRGLIIGVGAAATFAILLALLGALAVQASSSSNSETTPVPANLEPRPANESAVSAGPAPTPEPAPRLNHANDEPREVTSSALDNNGGQITAGVSATASSSTAQEPRTAASSWSAPPEPADPVPSSPVQPDVERLTAAARDHFGVVIHLDGWDWGPDGESQLANVQAVIDAIERLPEAVVSAAAFHEHGTLSLVSNDIGRTLDGWQPYGSHPMSYYTNSDQGPGGYHAANQVVLSVGASSMSIGHEILHAYQFRNVGPDAYALALLQPEMRSFMESTGWRQEATDEQVRQAVNQPWSVVDELFAYDGRPLTYTTAGGTGVTLSPANPAEAFAVSGAMYYARPPWIPLPDWPAYWAWFDTHLA